MTSHQTETPDWLSLKWAESNPFSQPGFNPYINDPEVPFDETFGYPTDWNSTVSRPQINSAFSNLQPLSSDVTGPILGVDLRLRTAPPFLDTGAITNEVDQGFSEEVDDNEDGGLTSDYKTTPVTPSTTIKNSFIPTCHTKLQNPGTFKTSPSIPKRQKRTKSSKPVTSSSNKSPEQTRRRSQRKRSISTRATQSYMEPSTEASSPEITHSPEVERRDLDAAFKNKKCHNLTEKKYRNRLNGYFDRLLAAIPRKPGMSESDVVAVDVPERKISKGEVLVLALEHIRALERQRDVLEKEKKEMGDKMARLKSDCEDLGGEVL